MPPKKAGKSKDGPAKFADKENLARAETEVLSLQRILELRSFEALEARRTERIWRERNEAYSQAMEQQREDTLDITSDLVRQYKTMQEKLGHQLEALEGDNIKLKQLVEEKEKTIQRLEGEQEAIRKKAEAEILSYQKEMADMQVQFATMLRETLDKMHEKLASKMDI